MNPELYIAALDVNAASIAALARPVTAEQARWKPSPDEWSILEIVNHLYDEERLDFRTRLDLTLHQPEQPWPPINPEGWVRDHAYSQRELQASLDNFLAERRQSLAWLRDLAAPDWGLAREHPTAGIMRAGDVLAAWAAHDLLHLRQLVELHWQYLALHAAPVALEYAGGW